MKATINKGFIEGFGRALDLGSVVGESRITIRNTTDDKKNIYGDWENVGKEIRLATRKYESNCTAR